MIFAALTLNAQFYRDTIALKCLPVKDFSHLKHHSYLPYPSLIPGNFYTENFGFMCKQEKKFEKFSRIPFRFRLGSVSATDRLEGKRLPLTLLP